MFKIQSYLVFFCFAVGFTQSPPELQQHSSELKINVFNLIILQTIDLSFERLANKNMSYGLGVLYNTNSDYYLNNYEAYLFRTPPDRQFSVTSYIRYYFSKSFAKGFYVEGFGMLNSGKGLLRDDKIEAVYEDGEQYTEWVPVFSPYLDFGVGSSLGAKFVKGNMIMDIYAGVGTNTFFSKISPETLVRGGFSLGYRF